MWETYIFLSYMNSKRLPYIHPLNNKIVFRFMIISSCPEDWGGSEELWYGAVMVLAEAGHQVYIYKTRVNSNHPRIISLRLAGCSVTDLYGLSPLSKTLSEETDWTLQTLQHGLKTIRPHLTVIAQGSNFDGMLFADLCRRSHEPYVIIAQKVVDAFYPLDHERELYQRAYHSAVRAFFVSRHNLKLTQFQLALPLPQAKVVHNPVNVPFEEQPGVGFPELTGPVRLACVARLFFQEKGQDILLEVLAQEKWQNRNWRLTFFGAGPNRKGLEELVVFLGLTDKVDFAGHVANPATIWQTHHALVLPSRSEGLPLALVEAMLCGRPAIAADNGGISEVLVDNVTGFLASATVGSAVDEALERAWSRKEEWPAIGKEASRHIRATVPADPVRHFAHELLDLIPNLDPERTLQPSPKKQPLVSIIIPTYNRSYLVERAIRSVQAQTYTNWQLIVVDDGSTDDTQQRLKNYDFVQYYYQENKGQGAARNHGLRYCQGEFIVSLDSDDEWFPNFLTDSISILEKHNLDFVFSNHVTNRGENEIMYFLLQPAQKQRYMTSSDDDWWLLDPAQSRHLMIETCPTVSSATVIRRSVLPKAWNESMKIADDWFLVLEMVLNHPCRIAFTLTPRWMKHVHDTNIYHSRNSAEVAQNLGFHDETQILARFSRLLKPLEKRIIRERIAMYHYVYALLKWKQSRSVIDAINHLSQALGLAPTPIGRLFISRGKLKIKRHLAR
ncbi:glycosyltransferase [Larkinella sp. VNQ87]|uniref:glycosyltransferase n=1 Tax=Larkinella sp. VNQ87 TaxID=3400921 RepID=UPI003C0690B8